MSQRFANNLINVVNFLILITASFSSVRCLSEAPKIEQHPNSIAVNVSDPVTLECRATGHPKPKITWFKDGLQLNHNSNKYTLIHDANLFIFSASLGKANKSDAGTYYCKAENEHGFATSSNANLIITYMREDFREVPKSRQVNSGVTVLMECKAPKGVPEPVLVWEKNGVQLNGAHSHAWSTHNSYFIHANGTLVISNASLHDAGEYVCVAKNDAAQRYSPSATLNVFDKPSFLIRPESSKFALGSRVQLKCEAQGYPKPQIEWKKDGSMDNIPLKAQISDTLLLIPNVQLEDEGEYTCVASNQLGSLESKAYLFVYDKPQFLRPMSNITVGIETKSLTIECNARGKPSPVIYWAKSASQLAPPADSSHQDEFIILENGNLFIEKLSKKYEGTYLCQASNEHGSIESRTFLQVKPIQLKPPPLIVYWPQNQTIPINTQALLECFASNPSNILLASSAPKLAHSMSVAQQSDKILVQWFKNGHLIQIDPNSFDLKYRMHETGSLEINSVSKADSGQYKCVATNSHGQTHSKSASLNVENPNNQYVEFQRNYEPTALPSAPTQPQIVKLASKSAMLSWQASSHSGHSPIRSYTIEYFSPEWPSALPGWQIAAENIVPDALPTSFLIENLQPDTYYVFIVRARNDQGYGPPSQPSDLIRTSFEPHYLFSNKNSNEILEKALTGEVVQLNEPVDVLSSQSINITWKILKSAYLIEGFYLKFKPIGAKEYQTVKILNKQQTSFVLNNLLKFTAYEFLMEPYAGSIRGSESNIVQARTREDVPAQSPTNLHVELNSINSLSIKWQQPPQNYLNGHLHGFKIVCQANETKFSLNLNANSTTRALILGNLLENMRYCVKIAAYNSKGIGPYTSSKCVEMTESNLKIKQKLHSFQETQSGKQNKFLNHYLFKEAWFQTLILLVLALVFVLFVYLIWYTIKKRAYLMKNKHKKKYLHSSENCSLNGTAHKSDQIGHHRYKLVSNMNDPHHQIWLDTMHSNTNSSSTNPDCCACVPSASDFAQHHSNNHHINNINHRQFILANNSSSLTATMERKRVHNLSIKSKYAQNSNMDSNTTATTNTANINISSSLSSSDSGPQYAEIYAPLTNTNQANPYATTGLFCPANNCTNLKYSSYTISNQEQQKQNLIKHIQNQSHSQANTPRLPPKTMQNNEQQNVRNFFDLHKNILLTKNTGLLNSNVVVQAPVLPHLSMLQHQQQQQQQQQQQHLIDEYVAQAILNNQINSINFMNTSTLARNSNFPLNQTQQSAFTAQHYLNRQLSAINPAQNNVYNTIQQDYSTIGNEDNDEADMLLLNQLKSNANANIQNLNNNNSNSNNNNNHNINSGKKSKKLNHKASISSSYDAESAGASSNSTQNQLISTDSNSSNSFLSSKRCSKTEEEDEPNGKNRHYANHDDDENENDEAENLIVRNDKASEHAVAANNDQKLLNEFYSSDLPQTVL